MNILLTCAGRRNYLVQYFSQALGGDGKVFAVDSNPDASALQEADYGWVVPSVDNPGYLEHLLKICRENRVSLVIPLNDLELPLLARHKDRFDEIDTTLMISSPEVIDTCFDKWETHKFLKCAGIDAPKTYLSSDEVCNAIRNDELTLPLVLKPRWGSGSIGIEPVYTMEDIASAAHMVSGRIRRSILANASQADPDATLLFQEHLTGQEYGIDVVNDFSGRYLHTFVRQKLAMRAGETDHAIAIRSERLETLGEKIGRALGHVGILDCDVFDNDGKLSVLEMNARFGGGYPFTHTAGANLPAALIALKKGEQPSPRIFSIRENTVVSKCDRLVVIKRGFRPQFYPAFVPTACAMLERLALG